MWYIVDDGNLPFTVSKEQSTNNTLQGNVKEKEKELRKVDIPCHTYVTGYWHASKLQEQLDLLAFHNERLTKRIEAVQEHEQVSGKLISNCPSRYLQIPRKGHISRFLEVQWRRS